MQTGSSDPAAEGPRDSSVGRPLPFDPGVACFRVNIFFQRAAAGAAFRLILHSIKTLNSSAFRRGSTKLANKPRGLRARHRPERLGQVDDVRPDARPHQSLPSRAHPHDPGPDRSCTTMGPAPPTSARSARTRQFRGRGRRAALRRPRCDPRLRDARPPDGSTAPRPPRRDTSGSLRCTRRARRRRSTASSMSSPPSSRARCAWSSR